MSRQEQPGATRSSQVQPRAARSSEAQPRANLRSLDASCAHGMRRVRRDRASAAGCATTRATTTTRTATPTAMHVEMQTCIVDVGSQGQLNTANNSQERTKASNQERTKATKSIQEESSGHERMFSVVNEMCSVQCSLQAAAMACATAHSRLGFGELSRTTLDAWSAACASSRSDAQNTNSELVHV